MEDRIKLWEEKVRIMLFTKERDEACQTFDVDVFKRFYRRWVELGVYEPLDIDDKVIEIMMRKLVCNIKNPDAEKLKEAKAWLKEKGYSEKL